MPRVFINSPVERQEFTKEFKQVAVLGYFKKVLWVKKMQTSEQPFRNTDGF